YTHTAPAMRMMLELLRHRRAPSDIMAILARDDAARDPYAPCPCGGGAKFRFCHGAKAPRSPFSGLGPVQSPSRMGRGGEARTEPPVAGVARRASTATVD